jgi:hypothetical protein
MTRQDARAFSFLAEPKKSIVRTVLEKEKKSYSSDKVQVMK